MKLNMIVLSIAIAPAIAFGQQGRPAPLDRKSCEVWFKRAEIIRLTSMRCPQYIDDELPEVIGTQLERRGCVATLQKSGIEQVKTRARADIDEEQKKSANHPMFCATMRNYRNEVWRMLQAPPEQVPVFQEK